MEAFETPVSGEFVDRVALLWQKILRVDHANTFAGASAIAIDRPHGHDRLPQPGYVGVRYRPGGILLLGQNPGNDPIGKGESAEDLQQYALLHRLKDAPAAAAVARELMAALAVNVMPTWPIIRNVVQPLLTKLGIGLDDIAYTNLVKFRTINSGIKGSIYDASWPVTLEQISLLNPANIIALGVETNKQFKRLYRDRGGAHVYHIPRAIGDTRLSAEGAEAIDYIVRQLLPTR